MNKKDGVRKNIQNTVEIYSKLDILLWGADHPTEVLPGSRIPSPVTGEAGTNKKFIVTSKLIYKK